ncbi:ASCH domain-containing protein [Aeromonas dhakensis]|uniref:ASCH domain-containing protein n=1 Tax=Aeromonas dhakensis TaxID=196024 RepID=UPI0038D1AEF1
MRVLLSIKPEFAELILDGEKKFEFRKRIFKDKSVRKVIIYATKPVGRVIGEFDIGEILSSKPNELWDTTKKHAGISRDFFESYFLDKNIGFAIAVKNPKRYDEPMLLGDFLPGAIPPQSYRYV